MCKDNSIYFASSDTFKGLKARAVKAGSLTLFSQIVNNGLHLISTIILARLLTPEDFGHVAMVVSFTYLFVVFKDFGLTDAIIQSKNLEHSQTNSLFWINISIGFAVTLLIAAISPLIAWFYDEPKTMAITLVWSLHFLFGCLASQHFALLRRAMFFGETVKIQIASSIISYSIAIGAAFAGAGVWALVARRISQELVMLTGSWLRCGWRPSYPNFDRKSIPLIAFGSKTVLNSVITFASRSTDKILIGWRSGSASLGMYQKAYDVFMIPVSQLSMSIRPVAVSTLSKLSHEPTKFKKYYLKSVSIISILSFPLGFSFSLTSDQIVFYILGPQWTDASSILAIISCSIGFSILLETLTWIHQSLGRAGRLVKWGFVRATVTVALIVIGAFFGIVGIAAAFACSSVILIVPGIQYAGKLIGLNAFDLIKAIWQTVSSAAIGAVATLFLVRILYSGSNHLILLVLNLSIYLVLYLATLLILHGSVKPFRDVREFLEMVLARKTKSVDNSSESN